MHWGLGFALFGYRVAPIVIHFQNKFDLNCLDTEGPFLCLGISVSRNRGHKVVKDRKLLQGFECLSMESL